MKIFDASIKIIKDSRGKDTLEAGLKTDNFSALASAPSGKSRGAHEAFVLEPKMALEKFKEIKPQILAAFASGRIETQEEFDNFLISLDDTPNKSNLGGNLTLVLSLAFARLMAKNQGIELFRYINQVSGFKLQVPKNTRPFFNVVNGGAHATHPESKLDFQEFQIIPDTQDFGLALGLGQEFYRKLKEFLENKFGKENVMLGDEAGFSCPFKNNEEAIEILADLIVKHKYPLKIGLDTAATQFYQSADQRGTDADSRGHYLVNGKKITAEELKNFYLRLIESYKILSIEDPFYEDAFDDFSTLSCVIVPKGVKIITDDLTTTNPERVKIAIDKKAGNAILIKPDQIGTLTETLKVVQLAYENNWQTIVSHRSGETMDDFIADLAVGINAWGFKAGAPAAAERLIKYERILQISNIKSQIF